MHPAITALANYLRSSNAGDVHDSNALVDRLKDAWPHLDGSLSGGMSAEKLHRLEVPKWKPPVLTFHIERHGGTVLGSTRAEIQRWVVNIESGTAEQARSTHRQVRTMAQRWSPHPLAEELANAIRNGKEHRNLCWRKKGTVALTGDAVPEGFKQTVAGRKKRLKAAIAEILGNDWQERVWKTQA
jgi:hypothetical protein